MLKDLILQAAKAIVAFIVPIVVVFVGEKAGIDIDPLQLETFILGLISAVTVYFVPNSAPSDTSGD